MVSPIIGLPTSEPVSVEVFTGQPDLENSSLRLFAQDILDHVKLTKVTVAHSVLCGLKFLTNPLIFLINSHPPPLLVILTR